MGGWFLLHGYAEALGAGRCPERREPRLDARHRRRPIRARRGAHKGRSRDDYRARAWLEAWRPLSATFSDVPATHWASQDIGIAKQSGLMQGSATIASRPIRA